MKELDYIYTDGNSLISLPIICKSTLKIQIDLMMTNVTGGCIIGNYGTTESDSFRFFNYNQQAYLDFGSSEYNTRIYGGNILNNTRYNIEIGNRYVKNLNTGSYFCQSYSVSSFIKPYNLLLFRGNMGSDDYSCKGYFYSLKIYDDNKLVFDAFPAMNDNGDIGLYDKVTHKLYPNTGTGPLTYGSVVREFSDELYLIKSEDSFYSVDGTKLDNVTALTSSVFEAYGSFDAPSSNVLKTLTNPSILIWSNDEVSPHHALITATPFPQTIISNAIDLSDSSVNGIEKITCEYEGNPLIACSFDNEKTWKTYIDGVWGTLSESDTGMTVNTFISITSEEWSNILKDLDFFKLRFTLSSFEDSITNIIITFIN